MHMVRRIKPQNYIHERADWPRFRWDHERLSARLVDVRHRQGRLIGRMETLGFPLRAEAILQTLTEDVVKSSEIEGEVLDRDQVRSSIARRLGIDIGGLTPADRNVEGVVEMILDATQNYDQPLTGKRLFDWHSALFPTGRSGMSKIKVGSWRDDKTGPMQVVSGAIGKERVHYEAPEAGRLRQEMKKFLDWFEKDGSTDLVIKTGVAHLWFVTIHPFDDGNGPLRIWFSPVPSAARNVFTACRRKSGRSAKPITRFWNRPKKVISTSRPGSNGFWIVWVARSSERRPHWGRFSARPASGTGTRQRPSMTGSGRSSINCSTVLKAC
jgi:hypothetical protein